MPLFDIIAIIAHVTFGTVAVAVGAIALALRKGGKVHVAAGRVFVVTMGLSSLLGTALGALKYETFGITFFAGILGATLVASGVLAVRIHAAQAKRWFVAIAGVNTVNAAGLLAAGWWAATLPGGELFAFPAEDYLFLFGMAAIATVGDVRLIMSKVISQKQRIAQHLTRMCVGFFIAAGSAFTGPGASVFPQSVQNSGLLSLPELIVVLAWLFWLWKTLRRPRSAGISIAPTGTSRARKFAPYDAAGCLPWLGGWPNFRL